MRKRIFKNFFILSLVLLIVLQQGSFFMGTAAVSTDNNPKLILALDGNPTPEKTVVIIKQEAESVQKVELHVPQDATFDTEKTEALGQGQAGVTYNANDRKVIIEWNTTSPQQEAKVVFKDLAEPNYLFIAEGIHDETKVKSNELAIQMPAPVEEEKPAEEEAESVEETEVEEEKTAETTEVVEEEKSTEDTKAVDENKTAEVAERETITENSVSPFSGDLNIDIDISPHRNTVLSGNAAGYNLILKVTGSRTEYTNAKIIVDLPITDYTNFTQDVNELIIDGVTPTYNESTHQLVYEFESIQSGRSYETTIMVDTKNGISLPEVELIAQASFEADEQPKLLDEAIVNIDASGAITSSKQFLEVKNNNRNLPTPNSTTLWEIKIDIPKKDIGQMYLKENSQIVITDILPSGLTYVSMEEGPVPTHSGNQLTWTFDAPSINAQTNANDEIFSTTLKVLLKVTGTAGTKQENNVNTEATLINNETISSSAKHEIPIVDSDKANGDIQGTWYVPNHFGPSGGLGGVGNNDDRNPNPVVYDDALLKFTHGIAPLTESKHGDFQQYTTSYTIDPNLIFKELQTPGGFNYRPNATFPSGIPLKNNPVFNIKAIVNGVERLLVEDANTKQVYTRSDLGLAETDSVSVIYYDFTTAPAGMLNTGVPQYIFEVVPGYVGEVKNVFDVYGINGAGNSFANEYNSDPLAGPRTAQIAPRPESQPPIAMVQVELLDHESGEIVHGENRVKVTLENSSSSTIPMSGPLETVILLPIGVTLNSNPNPSYTDADGRASKGDFEVLSNNYNESGRQLVKIKWNDDLIRIGKNLGAEIDVTISDGAPNTLQFDVYGFSGDEELRVPESAGESITDTFLQTDESDLNGDQITDQPRLKSGNIYIIRGKYDIQTEKLVKGELDEDFTYFGHTIPNGAIDYQVKLTNTTGVDITKMTLIDVLPSDGDLGITDNVDRGSRFTPKMTKAIILPAEWLDKVDVVYSTTKNPNRDDLTKNTVYPDSATKLTSPAGAEEPNWLTESAVTDWSTIHSFKIELKDGVEWIKGQDMVIQFSMKAPSELEVDRSVLDSSVEPTERAAWNSFAVATDQGQPVEPLRVGVYMDFDIEDPSVEKTVNDQKETVELLNRDELFTWKVDYDFGNYTANWNSVILSDQIHALLDIESVKVVDQDGNDVSENGGLTTVGNLVKFEVNKKDGSFAYLADQTYSLIIESKIKDSATDEQLQPFVEGNGIPNEGVLTIDDDPKKSNEVFVKPPGHGSLEILKVDDTTGTVLQGAEFELRKCEVDANDEENCEVVVSGTTDENGKLLFEDIPLGDYKLFETKAPEGYNVLTEPLDVKIIKSGEVLEFEVENTKTGWDLPDTGGMGTILFYAVGALLMIGAVLFLLRKRTTDA